MYLTGFADEAAQGLKGQIEATKSLGWNAIESRGIDGKNIHDMPDDAFDRACAELGEAGVSVNCFGSTIANWGKKVDDPFDITLAEIDRAIPRMQRLGMPSRCIRGMARSISASVMSNGSSTFLPQLAIVEPKQLTDTPASPSSAQARSKASSGMS